MITRSSSSKAAIGPMHLSAPATDVLSDVLLSLGVRTRVFCRATLGAPWLLQMPEGRSAQFHLIERGSAFVLRAGHEPLALEPGDLAVVARDQPHQLSSSITAGTRHVRIPPSTDGRCRILQKRSGEPVTEMLCGGFGFASPDARLVDAVLPPVLHLKAGSFDDLAPLLSLLWQEATDTKLGASVVAERLTDVLFVRTIRYAIERGVGANQGWLLALQDRRIAAALARLHANPAMRWTVARMAAAAGMSRARFAARFTELLGMPPLNYLTRLRIAQAALALRSGADSLREIAERAGYESPGAFSNVFRRIVGSTPGAYRRSSRDS